MTRRGRYLLAFGGALAAHAVALFSWRNGTSATALPPGPEEGPGTIDVELIAPPGPPADPSPPEPDPPLPPEPEPASTPEPLPEPAPEPVPETLPAPTPDPEPPKPQSATKATPPARKTKPQPPQSQATGAGPGMPAPRGGGGGGGSGPPDTQPRYVSNPRPPYPPESRRAREEGVVQLAVSVDATGRPRSVSLAKSSGHPRLDRAAAEAVKRWRFKPATRAGKPTAAEVTVPVRFSLD